MGLRVWTPPGFSRVLCNCLLLKVFFIDTVEAILADMFIKTFALVLKLIRDNVSDRKGKTLQKAIMNCLKRK